MTVRIISKPWLPNRSPLTTGAYIKSAPAVIQSASGSHQVHTMTDISLEFIQDLLRDDYPDVVIEKFEGAPGSKRGDNYTSMVYRITLKGIRKYVEPDGSAESHETWKGSLIYKCLPESVLRREAFKSDELFRNEVAFYTKIWPAMSSFQSQWKVKQPFKGIPKCYLARNDCVVLKDLKQYGFVMPDRRQGLTAAECYVVLKNLSQYHALSLAMKCQNAEKFFELLNEKDGINEVFFVDENIDYYRTYYNEAIQNAIAMVEEELKDSETKDFYLEKFRKFCSEDTFFTMMVDLVKPREPLAVICHGDCWTNNFQFRYADGEIVEMYFVDFQLVRYASPALDLVYIMYLCLDRSQRQEHQDSLLQYYVDELQERLAQTCDQEAGVLGSLDRDWLYGLIQEEFTRCSPFGLGVALDMLPILTCDSNEAPNVYQQEDVGETTSEHVPPGPVWTSNAICRKKMTDLVQEFADLDII